MKRLLILFLIMGAPTAGYYSVRLYPLLTRDNSELADADGFESMPDTLVHLAGSTAKALHTGRSSFPASLPAPYYPVGVIAGRRDNPFSNK